MEDSENGRQLKEYRYLYFLLRSERGVEGGEG